MNRLRDRTRESRALGVQARTLQLLQTLGLGERLVARGNTSTRLNLHLEGRAAASITLGDIGAVDTRVPFISFTEKALASRRFGANSLEAAIAAVHAEASAAAWTGARPRCSTTGCFVFSHLRSWSSIERWLSPCATGLNRGLVSSTPLLARDALAGYHLAHSARG